MQLSIFCLISQDCHYLHRLASTDNIIIIHLHSLFTEVIISYSDFRLPVNCSGVKKAPGPGGRNGEGVDTPLEAVSQPRGSEDNHVRTCMPVILPDLVLEGVQQIAKRVRPMVIDLERFLPERFPVRLWLPLVVLERMDERVAPPTHDLDGAGLKSVPHGVNAL